MKYIPVMVLSRVLRYSLEVVFWAGLCSTFALPFVLRRYFGWYFEGNQEFYRFILGLLVLCGVSALVVVRQLISVFKSIDHSNPFVYRNVVSLRNISICCFIIALLFGMKCIFYLTFLTFVVAFVFVIAGFSALVFSALFMQAVEYKSENDLTI